MKPYRTLVLLTLLLLVSGAAVAQTNQLEMMRQAGAAFPGLRDDLANDAEAATIKAHDLVQITKGIEAYWTLRNINYQVDDGLKFARDAHRAAVKVAKALDEGKAKRRVRPCRLPSRRVEVATRNAAPPGAVNSHSEASCWHLRRK